MTIAHYIAHAKDSRILELPEEAQSLGIQPGEAVSITVRRPDTEVAPTANERGLAALREISRRQQGRRHTDGSQTDQIIREGRAGMMYDGDASS